MIEFANVTVQYSRSRIYRRLHIEPDTPVFDYAEGAFPSLVEAMEEHLHMENCYSIFPRSLSIGVEDVDDAQLQVACISSCSEEILDVIMDMMDRGDYLEGYILNDLSNEVLFNASNQMNREIAAKVAARGCRLSRRYSPGEGGVELGCQRPLLDAFRGEPRLAHVRLTESFMLEPEKSMLYVFGADPSFPERSVEHDCSQCPNTTCFFRMEGEASYYCND